MSLFVGLALSVTTACVAIFTAGVLAVRRGTAPRELGSLVPNLARLLPQLLHDRSIPLRVRARIMIAVAYNAQPINLIPDFVPVIGLRDNVLVVGWALRNTVRRAGREAIVRHWNGSPEGLAALYRLIRLKE
jgi:uncharacterized membrane protein YkvA (DUF1232 family)